MVAEGVVRSDVAEVFNKLPDRELQRLAVRELLDEMVPAAEAVATRTIFSRNVYSDYGDVPGVWQKSYRMMADGPGLLWIAPTAARAMWVAISMEDPHGRESALSAPVRVVWP